MSRPKSRAASNLAQKIVASSVGLMSAMLLLELGCAVLVQLGFIPADVPSYTVPTATGPFMADSSSHFGVWHASNSEYRHIKECFDVVYRSNSYGSVDRERPRLSSVPRVIVLGDSFVEGYGVSAKDRFTDLLEEATGIPHLNFGTSGNFGPTQYYMLYKHLAGDFDHDTVLVMLLPDNDFRDDYPTPNRYKPYWKGEYPNFTLEYTLESVDESTWSRGAEDVASWIRNLVREFSYSANVYRWLSGYWSSSKEVKRKSTVEGRPYSGYFDYTPVEMLRLKYSLEQIRNEAGSKYMRVISIPRLQDFVRFADEKRNPLARDLQKIAEELDFEYLDLLPPMNDSVNENWNTLFHTCDAHWSANGHRIAADIILESVYLR